MKRIYYGSVTCEVRDGATNNVYNIASLTFAGSEAEANGWATASALKKFPQGKLSVVQMFAVPDDWVRDAVALLDGAREVPA